MQSQKSENSWKFLIIAPPPRENKEMFLAMGGVIIRTIRVLKWKIKAKEHQNKNRNLEYKI